MQWRRAHDVVAVFGCGGGMRTDVGVVAVGHYPNRTAHQSLLSPQWYLGQELMPVLGFKTLRALL